MKEMHVTPIPPEVLAQIRADIKSALTRLAPYRLALTPDERHKMLKMGDKTLSFVEKAQNYIHLYPSLCPSYLDIAGFDSDMSDAIGLRSIHIAARQLSDSIDDTMMAAGSDAYRTALVFYNAVKVAATQNVPGAKEIYADLKARFPGTRHKKREPLPSDGDAAL
ncbi:MAG: hypothetical protein LBH72_00330 [Proteiniphilum sp.]|jgi:hypothetical protein|nr:hypothetical protein [Proteiniphilum sp.]